MGFDDTKAAAMKVTIIMILTSYENNCTFYTNTEQPPVFKTTCLRTAQLTDQAYFPAHINQHADLGCGALLMRVGCLVRKRVLQLHISTQMGHAIDI